jgi:hypothetical protein
MVTLAEPQAPAVPPSAGLDAFFDHLRSTNPFTANRVNGPSPDDVDVPAIHQGPFERLQALAREARDQRRGIGAVLWGEAGVGKSHLISRLSRWADADRNACPVYLHNLQASAENLPRSLLKGAVSILTEGRQRGFNRTLLFRLANAGVRAALEQEGVDQPTLPLCEWAFHRLVDCLGQDPSRAALVDRTAYDVLFRFFRSDYLLAYEGHDDGGAGLAVRWLAGDFLDPDEARQLGLPRGRNRDDAVALADNQQIKQVLVALTQFALFRRQPFLLFLDQVDNLDDEQVAALARFGEALIDSSPNLLVVTAGVQETLVGFRQRGVIQSSAWDRLAQDEVSLHRIGVPESRQIIAHRLENFLAPFRELSPVREQRERDPLFPLGEAWAAAFFRDKIELRPRDVLSGAREAWRRQQEALGARGGAAWLAEWHAPPTSSNGAAPPPPPTPEQVRQAIDARVNQKIEEHRARLQDQPHTLPPDAGRLSGLIHGLLEQWVKAEPLNSKVSVEKVPALKTGRPKPALDLILRRRTGDQEVSTGLLVLITASTKSAGHSLRRLAGIGRPPDRLLLVTDARQPLKLGNRGEEYLAQLRDRGLGRFQHIELSFAEYAGLDALQAVVGLARSGDLEIEETPGTARRVSEAEVLASHLRQGRYAGAPVLRELIGDASI